jgi:hypothetical protein
MTKPARRIKRCELLMWLKPNNPNQNTTKKTTMKCTTAATLIITTMSLGPLFAQAPEAATPAPLLAAMIDDQTGIELAEKHGIKAVALEDLADLIKAVLDGDRAATLIHVAVDDDASDNPAGKLNFEPYSGPKPPRAPSPTLPMRVLSVEKQKYNQARAEWQRGMISYRERLVESAKGFIHQVAATQMQVAQRFDDMLAERNGRDFNRSDIVGCITNANRMLGKGGRRVLILNTDAKDLPGKGKPRVNPLTAEELDPTVELIFVNTSHLPQQEPLFRGLPNKVHEAPSMKSALAIVADMLAEAPADGAR